MRSLTLPAPAKLNRLLRITGRREDGYHSLQTLFQILDRGDTLRFETQPQGSDITLSPALAGVTEADNLIVRAARRLQRETGCRQGATVTLEKRLPMGGGLGGGSSNAATTLLALDRLWGLGLGLERLATLGLALGSDVPVFVRGRTAWAEGVGERLTAVDLGPAWFVIVHPGVEISTAAIFGHPGLTRDSTVISMRRALDGAAPEAVWRNDCESIVRALHPEVDRALDWLGQYGNAMLTGTGACVFCPLDDERQADQVLQQVPDEWQAFKARGCNLSPLHQALNLAEGLGQAQT
ncbi:MAG: 4-(cytidine 5'-diphospho)-2-C-methyl-D-erythritol kinase [Salinicola sp.]|uniref:4-(cytidine 5'-diphospho)-2-C-methyl-D-erythritol kinase n=1 Tax=uncultured Salinicola sp. TaxID=1193542 RepID=UPI000C8D72DB|nr:4-(cytidine 5'-diphospho)-2-C-methyl-D-erythritol kinase [uncultured Salinicola sp.]MAM56336.1 4-(cytidine 5'-diphospho)-2-C-methyl-D-erythritol kinase [Salinicola sp.]